MKKLLQILIALFFTTTFYAQTELLDSVSLALYQEYTGLEAALENPNSVIKLTLRRKKYKEFPSKIFQLKNLQYLDLSKNLIKEIPDSIVYLKNLQYLIVSGTKLEKLPANFGQLKNLKLLILNNNSLTVLPYSFGDLEKLEMLDLWSNELEDFPETLSKLTNLKVLDLRNILISQKKQDMLQAMLPQTKIYFGIPCNCQ